MAGGRDVGVILLARLWRVHSSADQERAVAVRVGFEPTIRFPVYTLSKRAPSATRPSLRDSPTLKRLTPLYSGAPGGQAKAGRGGTCERTRAGCAAADEGRDDGR